MSMQFWGVEVKAGKPLKVKPEGGKLIHISQAALGEGKREKGSELVPLRVNINDKKFVLGSLSEEKFPQITFDLVFEKEFELSHDWKNGSVYFCGYMADHSYDEQDDDDFDSEDDDEDLPLPVAENGKVQSKTEEVKPAVSKGKEAKPESSAKPKVTVVEPKKEKSDSDDDSDDSLEDDEDMLDADSDDVSESGDDDGDSEDDDDDDDSEDDDEETPKKPVDKKRPNESASKTPVPAKKNKVDSAQKTDGKKGGHVATPYPSKKAEKTPASSKQTPKSGAQISCNSCSKKFNSDNALQSHTKAKHAAK